MTSIDYQDATVTFEQTKLRFTDIIKAGISKPTKRTDDDDGVGSNTSGVVPEGFVVLSHRERPESNASNSDYDSSNGDGGDDRVEKPLFATKAAMSVFLSERWITIAAEVAAKDTMKFLEEKEEKKLKESYAELKSSNANRTSLWHHVLSSESVKEYSSVHEHSEQTSLTATTKSSLVTTIGKKGCIIDTSVVDKNLVTEKDWWRAIYLQDIEALRNFTSYSREFSLKMVASFLPRLEESEALTSLRKEMHTEKDNYYFRRLAQ